ncbi:hypothetical protein M5C72_05475 [Companilactobacillus allii]|uniref:Uncharacterized protein n=1 Tax=Companilactobacillus allii TaxID=1847728 RepID=A0A1P8Q3Z6_9LACO|nr:hypothetical protein [Companilactobacillus allii]APX72567.1 hypothetical protein BTM29_08390 [Companilactobacillus allii]USQ69668.1 hypothetical protein M5C72_05475 [Companilactobacillus allii]
MQSVILKNFIGEFNKRYDKDTYRDLVVVNNSLLDQSSIVMRSFDLTLKTTIEKQIFGVSPMNSSLLTGLVKDAEKTLPINDIGIQYRSV